MADFFVHLAHVAAWVLGVMFVFALIGVLATIRWIINLFVGTERAVESGVQRAEDMLRRK
ncbi:MAG TPA: hypothetical protein VGQ96_06410 [Candidatus Eremiobacteraceae bacterium]|nr:hypothetical protein [Candidatus Eremiobacteraceae bacterium]